MASRDDYNSGWQLTFEQVTKNYFKEVRKKRIKNKKLVNKLQFISDTDFMAMSIASGAGFKTRNYANCY